MSAESQQLELTNTLIAMTIKDLPEAERPRERFLKHGPGSLSTTELIAIILGKGTKGRSSLQLAHELLARFGGLKHLSEASIEELQELKGLGLAKAVQIKAAIALGFKVASIAPSDRIKVITPQQAYSLVKDLLVSEKREHFVAILLDAKSCLIRIETISIGTLTSAPVHPREVFHPAVRHNAASMILVHNHPSGDPTPSKQDKALTELLIASGKLMGISVHDHIIVAGTSYISLREQGQAF